MAKKAIFKPGDKVVLVNNEQLESESLNWSKLDGLRKGKRYEVHILNDDWIRLVGYSYLHPQEKFQLAKNQK